MISFKKKTSTLKKYIHFVENANLKKEKHQIEGIEWCVERETKNIDDENKILGGLIADEMGMGKTILMIGLIVSNFKKHTLIILPKSLLLQWEREIKKTLNHQPYLLYGTKNVKNLTWEQLNSSNIVLTTYGTINSLSENKILQKFTFDRIIVDEAHHLRNEKTKAHINVSNLSSNVLWLLTGTPIQNKIQELFRLFDLLKIPSKLYKDINVLPTILKTYMLRRVKDRKKLNLPNLTNVNCPVQWKNDDEINKSKIFHQKFGSLISQNMVMNDVYYTMNMNPLVASLHARMICISPLLLKPKCEKLYDQNLDLYDEDNDRFFNSTTKLDAVVMKLHENTIKNPDNKKIVFCHFYKEMEIIQNKLYTFNLVSSLYSGKLTTKKRQQILDESPNILLVQISSGSEGLNLQQYNEIYFVSPTWNPALESQALARCYRMGQTKNTFVYRFYMTDFPSVDEEELESVVNEMSMDNKVEERQQEKIKMCNDIYEIYNN